MPDVKLEFTEAAVIELGNMQQRVRDIGQTFGINSNEYVEAQESLIHGLLSVIRLGGQISKDGELCLYGASFIHFGLVWHPDRNDSTGLLGSWSCHS